MSRDAGQGRRLETGFGPRGDPVGARRDPGFGPRSHARPASAPDARTGSGREARFGSLPDAHFGPRPWPDRAPGAGPDPVAGGRARLGAAGDPRAPQQPPASRPRDPGELGDRQARALHPAPTVAPVRDPAARPQRGFAENGTARAARVAGPAAAPPREFGQPGEEQPLGGKSRRRGAPERPTKRRPRGRSWESDEPELGTRATRSGARSGWRRLRRWLWTIAAAMLAAVAALAAAAFLVHGRTLTHTLVTPSRLGTFVRRPQLEKQMNARQLQQQVVTKSAGQASHVVSAVYENSAGVSGAALPQIILFIGGNLAGVSPGGFITSFTNQFKGAQTTSAGPLGGQAACVSAQGSASGRVGLCTWADGDTFGVVASPTMSLAQLAAQMRAIRPGVERPAR